MVGLGTQDSLDEAHDFVAAYGLESVTMLWDPTFDSWIQLGINGQPAGMLLSADGTIMGRWSGNMPLDAVLEAAAEL